MTLRARVAFTTFVVGVLFVSPHPASAQDKKPDASKEKAAATENLKKIKIDKPTIHETDNFVIAGSLPEAKAKALGTVLEKTLKVARTAAKYDDKDTAWKGKFIVYFLPDADEYKSYMRRVLQVAPEGMYVDVRAEPPFIVDPVDLPGKPTDADQYANTAARVAGELLKAKGTGTQNIPTWLRDGFGRVSVMRAEGPMSQRYRTYRTQARAAILNPKGGKYPTLAEAMSSEKSAGGELLANSLAEFLAFGTKSADFGKFIEALRPSEENQNPTVQTGFMALGWKDDMTADLAWKRWVQTGK
jgi:hypothetical protein